MASALLGTVALLPVDRLLGRMGVAYERWVDDFTVEAAAEPTFLEIRRSVHDILGLLGQGLNVAKDWYEQPEAAVDASVGGPVDFEPGGEERPSVDALADAVSALDSRRCRYLLGGFRSRRDASAVPFTVSTPVLWEIAPKPSADYLLACRRDLSMTQLEELTEDCIRPPERKSAAGVAHRARVLAKRRVPGALGSDLHRAAERISAGDFRAAAPFLYLAASVSQEKPRVRHQRAIDTAAALRELSGARALVAGLRYDSRPRVVDDGLLMLARNRPELAPTIAWVGAG
jgi:hypothetical protein